jgi:hypothetical protein
MGAELSEDLSDGTLASLIHDNSLENEVLPGVGQGKPIPGFKGAVWSTRAL